MNLATKVYTFIIVAFAICIPLSIMLYCYGCLIKGLYLTNMACPETEGERRREKKTLVVTFIMAPVGFIIGYGPFTVLYTVIASGLNQHLSVKSYSVLSSVFVLLIDFSLCLNPIIYAFRSTNFQQGFKRIICGCRPTSSNERII